MFWDCRWANFVNCEVTVAQSVASPTADPGVGSSIPAWSHTFLEIDCEQISMVILLLPLIQEGLLTCCKLQTKVCVQSTG